MDDVDSILFNRDKIPDPDGFAVKLFSSKTIFEDMISFLKSYFTERVPSKKQEILIFFTGFRVIFEESLGKGFKIFELRNLRDKLNTKLKEEDTEKFLNRLIYDKQYNKFTLNPVFKDLNDFARKFNESIEKFGFCRLGKVYSGIFLIWRSFIRYNKSLLHTEDFKKFKGIAMEKACAQIIKDLGLSYEKIILKNRKMEGSNKYE